MKNIPIRKKIWLIVGVIVWVGIVLTLLDAFIPRKSYEYLIYSKDTLSAIDYLVTDGDTARMKLDSSDLRKGYDTFSKNRFYSNGHMRH